jgi:NADH-quinone oxidoreductase subunit E
MGDVNAVAEIGRVLDGHGRARQELIPILQDVQDRLGFLPREAVGEIAEFLDLSENDVFGVATFYSQFRFAPPGRHHIKVCRGTACHVRGSNPILDGITRKLGIASGETTEDRMFSLETVACFGSCALAPVIVVNDKVYGRMSAKKVEKLLDGLRD